MLSSRLPDCYVRPTRNLFVKYLTPSAQHLVRGSSRAAGWDICADENVVIPARGRGLVKTGVSISMSDGHYARLASRSGLAVKHGVEVGAGVIDADYRGEIMVLLHNHGDQEFRVVSGMRIAQLIVTKIDTTIVEKEYLDETERGDGGFGSTGLFNGSKNENANANA